MRFLKVPAGSRFSNKEIIAFILPIFLEQLMIAGMGIADTYMVASLGENAVAGVSLVVSVDKFIRQVFVALAAGGSIILSQYIGAKNDDKASETLLCSVHIVFFIGCIVSALMIIFKNPLVNLLFGAAEKDVLDVSKTYLLFTASSYPLMALYNAGTASYRAMGESRIPLFASISMMTINLILKYIFIYIFKWGVAGAGLSTALGMGMVGIFLVLLLKSPKNKVQIKKIFSLEYEKRLISRIFNVAVPNAIENGMFQFGLIVLQGLVATLGTSAIAANGIANNITPLMYAMGTAFSMSLMVIIGQCMGAKKPDEAAFYFKHVIKMDYLFTFLNGILVYLSLNSIVKVFDVSPETMEMATQIMHMYILSVICLYPSAMAMAYGLRGAGDTKFVMTVSIVSMFTLRIGAAYLFVNVFDCGIMGIWYAQPLDWILRSTMFWGRFIKGKWRNVKVI